MLVLAPLYFFYVHEVLGKYVMSNGSASNNLYGQQYNNEAMESEKLDATSDIDWRIWGGVFVPIDQVPYTVLYASICGGSLIAPNWVLTAAHCGTKYFIYAGSHYIEKGLPFAVNQHVYHPGWFAPKENYHDYDFLLLKLEIPIPTNYATPIALGISGDYEAGLPVSICGWGHTEYKFSITREQTWMTGRLQLARMTLVEHNDCAMRVLPYYAAKFGETGKITPRMGCAHGNKQGVCFGDSGGPVVSNGRLVGVVSWVVHCEPLLMFSKVYTVKEWITTTAGITE